MQQPLSRGGDGDPPAAPTERDLAPWQPSACSRSRGRGKGAAPATRLGSEAGDLMGGNYGDRALGHTAPTVTFS